MHYLCALSEQLAKGPAIKERLLYYPCSAYYPKGEDIRYIERIFTGGKRRYRISSVEWSPYVERVLKIAQAGATLQSLIESLTDDEISETDAKDFIQEIIDAQLLIHELEPAITGNEFLSQIIDTLQRINVPENLQLSGIIQHLEKIALLLADIDSNQVADIGYYHDIIALIKKLQTPFDPAKLFQVDIFREQGSTTLESSYQQQLLTALECLNKLQKIQDNTNLQQFIKRFSERYGDADIPLLDALDSESGVGYGIYTSGNMAPLIKGMQIPAPATQETQIPFGKIERFLLSALLKAKEENAYTIHLDQLNLDTFKNDWEQLPPSLFVNFRLVGSKRIMMESSGGSSAVNLLGRFTHGNDSIYRIAREVAELEEKQDNSVLFAEVVHLPESRIGNVLQRKVLHTHEIPFLSRSAVDVEHQISLKELYVSVKGGRIILRSTLHDKEIIPRLSSAHNWHIESLPVYHFLGDLQSHRKQTGIFFSWGVFEFQTKFLPRVCVGDVIVKRAQWNFEKSDYEHLLKIDAFTFSNALRQFREKWQIPKLVVLSDGDNELLVNLEDSMMTKLWLDVIRKRPAFIFKEFLHEVPEERVRDENGQAYSNEFIAILLKDGPAYKTEHKLTNKPLNRPKERFPLGSEWIYYKVYCGVKNADAILLKSLLPLAEQSMKKGIVDSFFFLRYYDPDFHIRIRFRLKNNSFLQEFIQSFRQSVQPYEEQQLIWKLQTDDYVRELERYGYSTIEQAEQFFMYDSIAACRLLSLSEGDQREADRWLWAMKSIDQLLNDFHLPHEEKMGLIEQLKNTFHQEFRSDKSLNKQLNDKYRTYKTQIEKLLSAGNENPACCILEQRSKQLTPVIGILLQLYQQQRLDVAIGNLLSSYIHMLVNRLISLNPRLHELIIYDMLFTYYRSVSKRRQATTLQTS